MAPVIDTVVRHCKWCGKDTRQIFKKTVKVYESPIDFTKTTTIVTHEYTCTGCGITHKD